MKIVYSICIALLSALLMLTGCSKDMGNYTYDDLNTYFVDTASIQNTFVLKQNETFSIAPKLETNVSGNGLTYEWRLMQQSFAPNPATGTYYNVVIGKERNLSYKITETPGDYMLVLYVKDGQNNGITQMIKRPLYVSSFASIGWMVIHGDAASSDVSIVVNNKLNAQLPANTDYVQQNVFEVTNGRKIDGEAANVIYMSQHWVEVFTKGSKGGYRVSGNDLRVLNSYGDMFLNPMTETEVRYDAYASWSYNQMLINKGGLYFSPQPSANTYNKYGVKCFGEDYEAAPYLATIMLGSYYGVIYDSKNRRFLYIDYTRTIKPFKAPGATAAFNMTNVGKEMVYAEHGFDARWFCLMQTPGDPTTRELYACKFNVVDDGNRGVARHIISGATELGDATNFAFGNRGNIMYYATDSKIYQSNYAGDLTSTLRMDVASAYPGFKVSTMKVFKVTNHANDGKIFYVALYNEDTKQGKLLEIDINEVTGVFGAIKEYNGFGRIAGMNYKTK